MNDDDQQRFDERVKARVALLEKARSVLPEEKFDALSEREIQEKVLAKMYGENAGSFSDRSDAYVKGRFQHALEAGRLDAVSGDKKSARADATDKRSNAREPYVPDWQKPLSYSRDRVTRNDAALPGRVQRGGVARDAREPFVPDWQKPLSYNVDKRASASACGARPVSLMDHGQTVWPDVPKPPR